MTIRIIEKEKRFCNRICKAKAALVERGCQKTNSELLVVTAGRIIFGVKLPKIKLLKFDGKSENWVSYYEAFRSVIYDNQDLTVMDMFTYLRPFSLRTWLRTLGDKFR